MSATFDLKTRLAQMGLEPKKALGQNFLISPHVIKKIVEAVPDTPRLVEVGPGLGALTEPLLARGLRPQLIEFDRDLAAYWKTRELTVFEADALRFDWNELGFKEPAILVSNTPYQISSSLVIDRCFGPREIRLMILMFQKEVAQRVTAQPGTKDYGLLTVMAQLHFKISKVTDASPGDFFPPPKIASRVLRFERLPREPLPEAFLKFLKQAFQFRRKFLLKNLKGLGDKTKALRAPEALKSMGLSEKARAEELSPQQLETLFLKIYEH